MSEAQSKDDPLYKKMKLYESYTGSKSIAADSGKTCNGEDTQKHWGMNKLCWKWQPWQQKGANRERWESAKAGRTALQIKNQICFGMVKANISFWSSLPSENSILIPFHIPAIINHLPLDTMCGSQQPGPYQSIPYHYLSDSRPSNPAAPEETLIGTILMPSSPLDPSVSKEGLSNSKKNLSLCF